MKPIRYLVLQAEQLSPSDKEMVAAKAATIFTGQEALSASYRNEGGGKWVNENWQWEIVDRLGRFGVLKYKGVEVQGYYKRQTMEVELLPMDPLPEGIIKLPADAWVSIPLLGLSARKAASRLGKDKRAIDEELILVSKQLDNKQKLYDIIETSLFQANETIKKKDEEILKWKKKYAEATSTAALAGGQVKMHVHPERVGRFSSRARKGKR